MSKDDKHRVIGKVVAISSDRFTIELLSGIENFNINGFDDIHYFAQVNSYVILPYQNYHIVAEIISIRERDTILANNITEQTLNKSKSVKYFEVTPIGTIKDSTGFNFGVSVYPPLYSDVLYIKKEELDSIFNVEYKDILVNDDYPIKKEKIHGKNTRLHTLSIGTSSIFENYEIKIDIDKFFGSHSAILGNTGSGKSCTISSMIQGLTKKNSYSSVGASFIILDVNGEYQQAFSEVETINSEIKVVNFSINDVEDESPIEQFYLPHWFLNIDEWALLLQASEKTQLPILRNALALAVLFSGEHIAIEGIKNHILATCITQILRDETSSPSKKDRIKSILQKFYTDEINLATSFNFMDEDGNLHSVFNNGISRVNCTIENCLFIHYGEMKGISFLHQYLEQKDEDGNYIFLSDEFKLPSYKPNQKFDFSLLEDALDIAILYEESYGNRQIRDYCSSMVTRFKSLQERDDYNFLKTNVPSLTYKKYRNNLLGIYRKKGINGYFKKSQISIIDLNSAEDEIVEVVSCVLSRIIYEAVKYIEPRNIFPVNLILEEAHRYISINQERFFLRANHIFERIAKEGRKYGMFLMISSQRPSELSKTVLSQCSNFIVHRIQNPEDLSHIKQITPHISDAVLKRLPSIPTQQALVFGHAVNLPALFKVNEAKPLPRSDNNSISRNWFRPHDKVLDIKFNR
ncbi:MAG: DUF87 domain-containing protein [Dysgonomonas sp.]|nr:DUF87 domain-containing protein [Dysgonomonas sp.]